MNSSGNTILITGGGSGIGRGLAEAFAAKGNTVIIAGRRKQKLDEVTAANSGMKAIVLDIDNAASIAETAGKLSHEFPSLNAVIHCAGIMRSENLRESNLADVEATITTNVLGTMRLNAALLPHFLSQKSATIMTVSSGLAFVPLTMTPTYCATKAAIHSYTQSLRYQLQSSSVQVIELIPPYVQTELMGQRQLSDPQAMPLADFIAESMSILEKNPSVTEVCVERVLPLRNAEKSGGYDQFFKTMNDHMIATRSN